MDLDARDARIVQQIRENNEEALVVLYRENKGPVSAFVRRNSGTGDDADDLLQEALIVLWERIKNGRFEQSARLSTFLFAVAKNIWLRRLAQKKRELSSPIDPDRHIDTSPDPLERLAGSEEVAALQLALDRLGEPCKKLLLLYYWEELSMAAIADAMGFANAETVKSKKYQCKKALKQLVEAAR